MENSFKIIIIVIILCILGSIGIYFSGILNTTNNSQQITSSAISNVTTPTQPKKSASSVDGCILWIDSMDSSTITINNGIISKLTDKSGKENIFTGVDNPKMSNNLIDLTGNSYLVNSTFALPVNYSIFAVGYTNVTSSWACIARVGPDAIFTMQTFNGNIYIATGNGSSYTNKELSSNPQSGNTLLIYSAINNNSNGTYNTYANGNLQSSGTTANVAGGGGIFIGSAMGGIPWNGFVGEFIIYNRVLSTNEYQIVEGYLAWKWGLNKNLPSSHPYYSVAP